MSTINNPDSSSSVPVQPLTEPYWEEEVTAERFHMAITAAKASNIFGAFVHAYPVEDYRTMKLFLLSREVKDMAGVAVKENGDIVSVFKHTDCKIRGVVGLYLFPKAIEHGGNHLDCFNTILPKLYAEVGFIPVSKTPFNDEFAPEDWNFDRDGRPDIIFMVYKQTPPETRALIVKNIEKVIATLKPAPDYSTAQEEQLKLL